MLGLLLTGMLVVAASAAQSGGGSGAGWVRPDEVRHAVHDFLGGRSAGSGEDVEIAFRFLPDSIRVARLPYTLRISSGGSGRTKGVLTLVVEIEDGARTVQRCMVTVVVRTYADVLVAARMIPRHTVPAAAHLRRLRMETTFMERPLALDPDVLLSSRTKRIVPQGGVLYDDLFEPVPLVLQGDRVHVHVRSGGVMLTAEGIAREDGYRGELIEVHLQGRTERVRARVLDAHTLTVPLD